MQLIRIGRFQREVRFMLDSQSEKSPEENFRTSFFKVVKYFEVTCHLEYDQCD